MPDPIVSGLLQRTPASYGDAYQSTLFEQYRHYVDSAERISERRVAANSYLLTVNTALISLAGFVARDSGAGVVVASPTGPAGLAWVVLVPIAGVLVSLTWFGIVMSYRSLNAVKFQVIHELERELPAALYTREWHLAEEGRGDTYQPVTLLERAVPLVFMTLYLALALFLVAGAA